MGVAQTLNLFDLLETRIVRRVLDAVLAPAHAHETVLAFVELLRGRVDDFGDGPRPHDLAWEDGRGVEAFRVLVFGDPGALGGVVGYVEGFDEDLVLFEGWDGVCMEREGLLRP